MREASGVKSQKAQIYKYGCALYAKRLYTRRELLYRGLGCKAVCPAKLAL